MHIRTHNCRISGALFSAYARTRVDLPTALPPTNTMFIESSGCTSAAASLKEMGLSKFLIESAASAEGWGSVRELEAPT